MYPSSKLKALDVLFALGAHLDDEHRLDRVVPYLIMLLADESASIRATALKMITQLVRPPSNEAENEWFYVDQRLQLSLVESITPADANIFPEYILPSLRRFASDPAVFVRATYAQCIATLCRFLGVQKVVFVLMA
jgi:phosphoinositide-3-kinase regulatory subunit 4